MIVIVDKFKCISERVSERLGVKVNFLFGDWPQIAKSMDIISKSTYTEGFKYPLLALFTPFFEDKSDPEIYCSTSVNLLLATRTIDSYTNEQRLEISYRNLLHPFYEALIYEIKKDGSFDFGSRSIVKHIYSDNMRYGSKGVYGSDGKSRFADHFDGIDITNLQLKVKLKNCRKK